MVIRKAEWPQLLSEYIKERRSMPFEWGVNDCMAFPSKAVERLTGTDFFTEFSGYDSEESAQTILNSNGGVTGIISKCLGPGSRNILTGKRGDLAIVKLPLVTGAIIDDSGQNILVVSREGGLIRLPLKRAWRVWSY